jgi:beta-galactosidase
MQKVNHFLHVEWGGDSHAGRYAEKPDQLLRQVMYGANKKTTDSLFIEAARQSKDGNWDESYACNLIDWHLKEQETMPWLTGSAQWTFKDFSTPLRPGNPVPYVNQKGVVERDGTKKESYYVFQSYWTTEPMVHIYGHNWPVRWGAEGEEKMIKVFSNCEQAELFVNGKSYGKRIRNSLDFPAAGLRWNIPMTKGLYVVKVVAVKGKIVVTDSIRFEYQSAKWNKADHAQLEKIKEENDIVTVRVKLYDEKNILCLDSTNWVRFGLAGNGNMIDNQGTASGSRYVQLCNGVAIIRIRMNGGHSVLSASVEGVPVVFISQ